MRAFGCWTEKGCLLSDAKISQRGNTSASLFPWDVNLSSLVAPGTLGWGRRGHFGPAQTSPHHPSGAVWLSLNELWQLSVAESERRAQEEELPTRWVTNTGCKWGFFCCCHSLGEPVASHRLVSQKRESNLCFKEKQEGQAGAPAD